MNHPFDSNVRFVSSGKELVRGREHEFIEELQPLVHSQSVCLDLGKIERIDAAGLSALITVYCDACKAGHRFAIANPSPRVREILALVGLDRILVEPVPAASAPALMELEQSAA